MIYLIDSGRLKKLDELRKLGINPYPYSYAISTTTSNISDNYESLEGKEVNVAGRIMRWRSMGKLSFLDLVDRTGKIQIMLNDSELDDKSKAIIKFLDTGDIIGARGIITKTKKGEISILSKELIILSKSLKILPEKFHGLNDTELRYRNRHLDFMVNTNIRNFFYIRASILKYVRDFLDNEGYTEFETPVLQHTYGGANAKPFETHHDALNTNVYLRIADELYLKRLIIGGFEKVYEVSKDFRNEDIDSTHNPEFTQVECYEAYKDYNDYMKMTKRLITGLVYKIFGRYTIKYQGKTIDFESPFRKIRWVARLKELSGIDVSEMDDTQAKEIARKEGLKTTITNAYHVADSLFDKYIKPDLWNPTYVLDFPSYMCPLTKVHRDNPLLSERFELYIANKELGNCYSELTDPIIQRSKFEEQENEKIKGDTEAPPSDSDFLEAVEYGMPPTAGIGISIDKLAMILTDNLSIKEVLAFPTMKPKNKDSMSNDEKSE